MLNYVWEFECNINLKTVWLCLEKVPSCTSNLSFLENSRQQISDVSRDQRALQFPMAITLNFFMKYLLLSLLSL